MNLREIQRKSIDIFELQLYEIEDFYRKNPHFISENANKDIDNYKRVIDNEKSHSIDIGTLISGQHYVPLSLTGLPLARSIIIFTSSTPLNFRSISGSKMIFTDSNGDEQKFPAEEHNMGDSCINPFIFPNLQDRNNFISFLKITFAGWNINIK